MKPMIFRKQKPVKIMTCWAIRRDYSEPVIVWFDRDYGAFEIGSNVDVTSEITHWGDRIEKPSVEIEEDELSATSSEPGDIAPLMGLLNNSSDEELDCLEQYFERQRES